MSGPTCVLICGPVRPPVGGVSTHIARLVERLSATGEFRFTLCDEAQTRKPGVFNLRSMRLSEYLGLVQRARIVHIHSSVGLARALHLVVAVLLGKKSVITLHSWRQGRLSTLLWRGLFALLRPELIVVSEAIAARFGGCGQVLPAFIEPSLASEAALPCNMTEWIAVHRAKGSTLLCSNAYRLTLLEGEDLYGLGLCIEALALPEMEGAALVYVVSDPNFAPERLSQARARIAGLNLEDRVLLHEGAVSYIRLIGQVDISLRTTLSDGDALSVRESLALGKHTIASDVAVRPAGTRLYASGDVTDLVRVIREAANTTLAEESVAGNPAVADCAEDVASIYRHLLACRHRNYCKGEGLE